MPDTFHAGPNLGQLSGVTVIHGDCIEAMAELETDSVDAIVTDPPYGLEFMGKDWDAPWKSADSSVHAQARQRRASEVTPTGQGHSTSAGPYLAAGVNKYSAGLPFQQWSTLWCVEAFRVLKPGGHILAFGGTRTWHRLAVAVEDAGFEIRDSIAWLYGSGFPKSRDIGKAIDAEAGATREVVGPGRWNHVKGNAGRAGGITPDGYVSHGGTQHEVTVPATPEAAQWQGWGTALKPAFEPIVVGRKPLAAGTVAANVLTYGTGALNIDATRIGTSKSVPSSASSPHADVIGYGTRTALSDRSGMNPNIGRWPANVILDEDQAAALDEQSGILRDGVATNRRRDSEQLASQAGWGFRKQTEDVGYGGSGGASRFFLNVEADPPFRYTPKAPKKERPVVIDADGKAHTHATVKPLALMRWLVRLVTPPGGVVLDPFAGSGTTVEAAMLEGFNVIGIEREADYLAMIQQRIARQVNGPAA